MFCALQALLSHTPIHAEHTKYVFYINVSIVINILGIEDEKENNEKKKLHKSLGFNGD